MAALRAERAVKAEATVGQFLAELALKADLKPKTLEGYAVAFRGIVADIFGIEGGKEKYHRKFEEFFEGTKQLCCGWASWYC